MKLCVFILFFSFQQQIYGRARHAIDDNLEDGEDMNLLRGDAVRGGEEVENKWFKAISPATLDKLITEMNSMNRWFAKVVKYWDDFTAGNNGASVLEKEGRGITVDVEMEAQEEEGGDGASTSEGPEINPFGGDGKASTDPWGIDEGKDEKSGDEDEEKTKDDEEEKSKGDGGEKPYDMGDEKPYDENKEEKENKDEKEEKEESDKKSEDDEQSDEKRTADDEEKSKDEEDKKSEKEEARRRRRRF